MSNVKGFSNTQKIKEEAAVWLTKIEEGPLSSKEAKNLRDWVSTSDVHRQVIVHMAKTWSDMDMLSVIMVPVSAKRWTPWALLRTWLLSPIVALVCLVDSFFSRLNRGALASLVAIPMLFGVWFLLPEEVVEPNMYTTSIGEYEQHRLEDGSIVWLNSNTRVEVQYTEHHRRLNLLAGEAYFKVEKDVQRPFEVYSDDRLVRALGTEFSVYKLDDRIEVFVSEGRVELAIVSEALVLKPDDYAVSSNTAPQKHARRRTEDTTEISTYIGELEAGQSISIPAVVDAAISTNEEHVTQLDAGQIVRKLSWLDGKLVFAGETLEEVVAEISRHTPMHIDVPDPVLRKMRIGGHFEAGDTNSLFYVLESGFGIHVNKISETHVELQAKK